MDHIALSHTLEKFVKENDLVSKLLAKFQNMNNIYTLKFDVEILSYISNVIENELNEHDADEKKAVVIKVMKLIFTTITPAEELIIVGQINYLVNNKRIKKISTKKYLYKNIGSWICRRIG